MKCVVLRSARHSKEKMGSGVGPQWHLVSHAGPRHRLPHTMIFLGREDCDINLESQSIDKRHAVLAYDHQENKFKVKDLGSINGTYVNDGRIPEEEYLTLQDQDTLKFGYDPMVYRMEQSNEQRSPSPVPAPPPPSTVESTARAPPSPLATVRPTPTLATGRPSPSPLATVHPTPSPLATVHPTPSPLATVHPTAFVMPAAAATVGPDQQHGDAATVHALPPSRELPAWATREVQHTHAPLANSMGMAECPGCIAEQEIRHTCSGHEDGLNGATTPHGYHPLHNHSDVSGAASSGRPPPPPPPPHKKWAESTCYGCRDEFAYPHHLHSESQHTPQLPLGSADVEQLNYDPERYHPSEVDRTRYSYVTPPDGKNLPLQSLTYVSRYDGAENVSGTSSGTLEHPYHPHVIHHVIPSYRRPSSSIRFVSPGHTVGYAHYPDPYFSHAGYQEVLHSAEDPHSVPLPPHGYSTVIAGAAAPPPQGPQPVKITETFVPISKPELQPKETLDSATTTTTTTVIPVAKSPAVQKVEPVPKNNRSSSAVEIQLKAVELEAPRENSVDLQPVKGEPEQSHESPSARSDTSSSSQTAGTPESPALPRKDQRRSLTGQEKDLQTVKKGTPLYGQPSWWGDDDADNYQYPNTATLTDKDKDTPHGVESRPSPERPRSLSLEPRRMMDKALDDPQCGTTYMEISHKDSPEGGDDQGRPVSQSSTTTTTSPKDPHTPPERDPGPGTPPSDDAGLNSSAMAFTVDFGGEQEKTKKKKKGNMEGKSLSDFLPTKVRRSFRERSEQVKEKAKAKDDDDEVGESAEEMEANGMWSPQRQRRADDAWTGTARSSGRRSARGGYSSDGHNSQHSSDNEEVSVRSDTYVSKTQRGSRSNSVNRGENAARTATGSTRSQKPSRSEPRRTPTSMESRKTPTNLDNRRTPTNVDNRKTPTNVEVSRKSSTARKTSTETRRGKGEPKNTPPLEKRKRSTSGADSSFLIEKMLSSTNDADNLDLYIEDDSPEFENYQEVDDYDWSGKSRSAGVKPTASSGEPRRSVRKSRSRPDLIPKEAAVIPDNVSESGTYTIELEEEKPDLDVARTSIDQIFGVSSIDNQELEIKLRRPVIHNGATATTQKQRDDEDNLPLFPKDRSQQRLLSSSVDIELGSVRTLCDEEDDPQRDLSTQESEPSWTSQWQSLANHKSGTRTRTLAPTNGTQEEVNHGDPISPRSAAYKSRPGTGRILPIPPVKPMADTDSSNSSTPKVLHSNMAESSEARTVVEDEEDSPGRRRATVTYDSEDGGTFTVSFDAPQRESRSAPQEFTQEEEEEEEEEVEEEEHILVNTSTRQILGSEEEVEELVPSPRQVSSVRSVGSLGGTEALLRDTESAVQAMSDRVLRQKTVVLKGRGDDHPVPKSELFLPIRDSDSDTSSTSAHIEPEYETPQYRPDNRPKPKYSKSKSVDVSRKPPTRPTPARSNSSTIRNKNVQQTREQLQSMQQARGAGSSSRRSSNMHKDLTASQSESETASILSSSTDYSESSPQMVRKASGGKGPIAMTRTNRAFALRRAKADDSETSSTVTPRGSRPNSASVDMDTSTSRTNARSRSASRGRNRPSSAQETSRSGAKTDLSRGSKPVDKSKDNLRGSSSASGLLDRKDGGRYSLRSSKTPTTSSSSATYGKSAAATRTPAAGPPRKKAPDVKDSKTKATPRSGSRGGPGGTSTKAQAAKQVTAQKAEEYNAWKRRKQYDPRRAVEDAKAKGRDARGGRSKSVGATDDGDNTSRSISSISSEESYHMDDHHAQRDVSRSNDIIELSAQITNNLNAMSRAATDSDPEDCNSPKGVRASRSSAGKGGKSQPPSRLSPPSPLVRRRRMPTNIDRQAEEINHSNHDIPSNGEDEEEEEEEEIQRGEEEEEDGGMDTGMSSLKRWHRVESYNNQMMTSVHLLSQKVKAQTDQLVDRIRENHHVSDSPSPIDDFLHRDLPTWKTANPELAATLNNLRKTEHYLSVIDRALFPSEEGPGHSKRKNYTQELQRIRKELAGFKPIKKPAGARTWGLHKQQSDDSQKSDPFPGDDYY